MGIKVCLIFLAQQPSSSQSYSSPRSWGQAPCGPSHVIVNLRHYYATADIIWPVSDVVDYFVQLMETEFSFTNRRLGSNQHTKEMAQQQHLNFLWLSGLCWICRLETDCRLFSQGWPPGKRDLKEQLMNIFLEEDFWKAGIFFLVPRHCLEGLEGPSIEPTNIHGLTFKYLPRQKSHLCQ